MAGIEPIGGGGAEGYVNVLTTDHDDESVETQEMNRTLAQFDMHPDQSGMMRHYQELVMRLVGGGRPPRVYGTSFEMKSVDEGKAFVGRVIAAVQNSRDKFERIDDGHHGQIRLRK